MIGVADEDPKWAAAFIVKRSHRTEALSTSCLGSARPVLFNCAWFRDPDTPRANPAPRGLGARTCIDRLLRAMRQSVMRSTLAGGHLSPSRDRDEFRLNDRRTAYRAPHGCGISRPLRSTWLVLRGVRRVHTRHHGIGAGRRAVLVCRGRPNRSTTLQAVMSGTLGGHAGMEIEPEVLEAAVEIRAGSFERATRLDDLLAASPLALRREDLLALL
jgi:hypothetical protein